MNTCIEPNNCPDEATGMPCNSCWSSQQLDQLATLFREALELQASASFTGGRYSAGADVTYSTLDQRADAAAAKTVAAWTLFYEVAGKCGDTQRELEKLRGVLARISAAAARVGIELDGIEL